MTEREQLIYEYGKAVGKMESYSFMRNNARAVNDHEKWAEHNAAAHFWQARAERYKKQIQELSNEQD